MDHVIKVTRQSEEISFNDRGQVVRKIRVEFRDGDHGPFSLVFDREGFTGYAALTAMNDFVRELRAARGE